MTALKLFKSTLILTTSALILSACSGSGGSQTTTRSVFTPPTGSSDPTWTPGTFAASSNYQARCETVRTGTDSDGNRYPDIAGSETFEKFWLRSWSHETYLWYTELPDLDPSVATEDRITYFDQLKTSATTASGESRDDFHFSEPTTETEARRNSAPSSGYGVEFAALNSSTPRDWRVAYTEAGSPAARSVSGQVNFPRGAKILEIDGVDFVNGVDTATLNAGLFPSTAGETHSFVVLDPGSTEPRTFTITSEDVVESPVNRIRTIDLENGDKIGYMLFNTFSPFSSEEALFDAFTTLSNQGVDDLVLDLRYNGGGLIAVAAQLGYMVAGDTQTQNRNFSTLRYNTNPDNPFDNTTFEFINEGVGFSVNEGTPLPSLNLNRVFILSTPGTCSASEAVINGLDGIDVEVILIGDTTCGKPYGFSATDNCGQTYYTIQFQTTNDRGFGDYSDGFVPQNSDFSFGEKISGCVVEDDFNTALGDENEGLFAAALQYREDGSCPALPVSAKSSPPLFNSQGSTVSDIYDGSPLNEFLKNNLDVTLPAGYKR